MQLIEEAPLEIYVDYTILPANQAAVILLSLENLYQLITGSRQRNLVRLPYRPDQLAYAGSPTDNESALSLESSITGNSITFRFAGRRQPTGIRWDGSDVEFVLPRWSAAAVCVGALLLGSMHIYDNWLGTQVKNVEIRQGNVSIERERAEIDKIRAETEEIVRRLREPSRSDFDPYRRQPDRHIDAVTKNIQAFHSVSNSGNIISVRVNGVKLK